MSDPALAGSLQRFGAVSVKNTLRLIQGDWRRRLAAPDWSADPAAWARAVDDALAGQAYRPVYNLTGTIIHTNLGRALPNPEWLDVVRDLVTRPMNLEYDLTTGQRGHRDAAVARRLRALTGAGAAVVVNNNAAALMLVLNTLALNRPVPVSRGELIEIGGSFRLPELMERAGCQLLEVGTTNRTHLGDYQRTASRQPALLLKVHPSNFRISGFTRSVGIREIAGAARQMNVPLCVDLGSGTLVDLQRWGLPYEPTVREVLEQGADLVTFSGDKLLGGVQAGIIVGSPELVSACQSNPMKRALRADKITLSLLDRVLAEYEAPDTLTERIPLFATLTLPLEQLQERARRLAEPLGRRLPGFEIAVVDSPAQIGSGSLPEHTLPSIAVRIGHPDGSRVEALHVALRKLETPVIGRISQGAVWLDVRGAEPLEPLAALFDTLPAPS